MGPSPPSDPNAVPPPHGGADDAVTVVVTCYNHGRFLADALASVLGQTRPPDEVLVVDDGSTDDTAAVAARYPGVRYLHQTNAGLSAARNAGARAASGAFVAFLDADDRLRPNAVAAGLACFAAHPEAAFVYGAYVRVDERGALLDAPALERDEANPYALLLRGNHIGMHAAVLYRRDALLAAGGFDPALGACEDYDLYLRIARAAPIAAHDAVVAEYRIHGDNMSHDPARMLRAALRVMERQREAVRGDAGREAALAAGVLRWQTQYADGAVSQAASALRRGRLPPHFLRTAAAILRHAPRPLLRRATRSARSRAGRVARVAAHAVGVARRLGWGPPVGRVRWGDLRRLEPISRDFGYDRGLPVDRHYIEGFLARHAADIRGRALEVGDATYTHQFGGAAVERADVLHVHAANPAATFVGDLAGANDLPDGVFDCVVLTQTLHVIYDLHAAVATLHRVLRPGGVLLLTGPGISQIERHEWGAPWSWSFTPRSLRLLLAERFPEGGLEVEAHGNVVAAVAFLHGLAARELTAAELAHADPQYPLLITARAVKEPAVSGADARGAA